MLVRPIDGDRELVVRELEMPIEALGEVTQPTQLLQPGERLVVPTGLLQITVALRSARYGEIVLYVRLVQEYAPHQVGYTPIDVRLVEGGTIILLAREPTPDLSLTVAGPTAGRATMARLPKGAWGSPIAAATPVSADVTATIIGSYKDGTLGVAVLDPRSRTPLVPTQFRLTTSGMELRRQEGAPSP